MANPSRVKRTLNAARLPTAETVLPREFYSRPTLTVARGLIGARLVRMLDGRRLTGLITETEAYIGEKDLGCHAKAGRTARTRVMYGQPGHAYVYFTYGNHWMLNAVTQREGYPAAVLIRAIQPVEGAATMSRRRGGRDARGPGKLTQAMGIGGSDNGVDITDTRSGLWIEIGVDVPRSLVTKGPRVGLDTVPEPWKSKPWRFLVRGLLLWDAEHGAVAAETGPRVRDEVGELDVRDS